MKPLPLAAWLAAALLAAPVHAEDPPRGAPLFPSDEELRALGEAAEEMARRLAERLDPMLERLRDFAGDLSAYEAPERLPNGDIILRRKPEAPGPEPAPVPEGGVAL